MIRSIVKFAGCLLCLAAGWAVAAVALSQEKSVPAGNQGGGETLPRLLDEVHQLRLALQRSTVANTRFQMTIERMRIQQAHVDGIQRELDGVRSEISNLESSRETATDRLKDYEERLERETGPDNDSFQEEIKRGKLGVASLDRDLASRRSRESELTALLQQEEGRLRKLDLELDGLMEELKEQSAPFR